MAFAPPLDFLLEFQEDQKIAAICRGSKKSSVLRRFGDSGALELWHSLLVVKFKLLKLMKFIISGLSGLVRSLQPSGSSCRSST